MTNLRVLIKIANWEEHCLKFHQVWCWKGQAHICRCFQVVIEFSTNIVHCCFMQASLTLQRINSADTWYICIRRNILMNLLRTLSLTCKMLLGYHFCKSRPYFDVNFLVAKQLLSLCRMDSQMYFCPLRYTNNERSGNRLKPERLFLSESFTVPCHAV